MTSTARQLRQPPTIEAIERVPYFADVGSLFIAYLLYFILYFIINILITNNL